MAISGIMIPVLNGREPKYRHSDGVIRWGLVQQDLASAILSLPSLAALLNPRKENP